VIDQRGASAGGMRLPLPGGVGRAGGGVGLVGILIFLAIQFLGGGGGFTIPTGFDQGLPAPGEPSAEGIPPAQDPQKDLKDFSAYVFTDAQQTWQGTFREEGDPYDRAKLVLYSQGVETGCGSASSSVGPFYCPADERVYIDLTFFEDMESQLGAGGDFAYAYVIAHEMGHHVQQEQGTSGEVQKLSSQNPDDANALSVRLELQADCYAGIWANTVFEEGALEEGDLDEAFGASEAVGDDRLQKRSTGRVDPDSFTHGSSAQRKKWFKTGYEGGDPGACDTFSVDEV
jgi:uncharacterized protein